MKARTRKKLLKTTGLIPVAFRWKDLKPNDLIEVTAGPYWYSEALRQEIPLGYKGTFKVIELGENGIHARGNDKEGFCARCFIYMGPPEPAKSGVKREPHIIKKWVNKNEYEANTRN